MKFKKGADILKFMEDVQSCSGDIFFISQEGDRLDLKSTLSQFLFASVCSDRSFLDRGDVECLQQNDYRKLMTFLQGDGQIIHEAEKVELTSVQAWRDPGFTSDPGCRNKRKLEGSGRSRRSSTDENREDISNEKLYTSQ